MSGGAPNLGVNGILVGPREGMELPPVCPRCGQAGSVRTVSKVQETPSWVKWTVFFGLVVAMMLSVLTARRAEVVSWFCPDCVVRSKKLRASSLLAFFVALPLVFVGMAQGWWPMAILGVALCVAGIQGIAKKPGVVREHVTDDAVSLKKIHPNVLLALVESGAAKVS
jgi:hypothetical protein